MSARWVLRVGLMLVWGSVSPALVQAQDAVGPAAGTEGEIATAPVELDHVVLFRLRGSSSFPAGLRAGLVADRIKAAADDPQVTPDSLRIAVVDGVITIFAADRPIMNVVDADASLEQLSAQELARTHLMRLQQAIAGYRAARSPAALRRAAISSLVATLLLAFVLWLLGRFWRWMDGLLMRRLQPRIHDVGIQTFQVVRADRLRAALHSGLLGFRTVIVLASVLVYVGLVLAQWPWTRGLSRDIVTFALGPLHVIARGVVENIPNLVFLTVLFFVLRLALRVIRLFFEAVGGGTAVLAGFDPEWAQPTYKIIRVAIIAFGLVVAYPYIPGSDSDAFKGVSLFIGIVFSLGSSSAISNIIAGYMITYRRAFKVGDRVKIGGAVGDVIEMRLQVTHLRSLKNEEIVIPNSQILVGEVLNYSSLARVDGIILHTEVGIGYGTPWRQVEALLVTAAERTPGLVRQPPPFVLVKQLGDFAVLYELNVYCTDVKAMPAHYAALHRNMLDLFNEYRVQIMTPAYEGDPAEPKIVHRKDWYSPPASRPDELPPPHDRAGVPIRETAARGGPA